MASRLHDGLYLFLGNSEDARAPTATKARIRSTTTAAMQDEGLRQMLREKALLQSELPAAAREERRAAISAGHRRNGRYRVSHLDKLGLLTGVGTRSKGSRMLTTAASLFNTFGAGKSGHLQYTRPKWSRRRRWGRLAKWQKRSECARLRARGDARWVEYWQPHPRCANRKQPRTPEEHAVRPL